MCSNVLTKHFDSSPRQKSKGGVFTPLSLLEVNLLSLKHKDSSAHLRDSSRDGGRTDGVGKKGRDRFLGDCEGAIRRRERGWKRA